MAATTVTKAPELRLYLVSSDRGDCTALWATTVAAARADGRAMFGVPVTDVRLCRVAGATVVQPTLPFG